ncbi:MAG: 23S rRNA (pseudouridine(1915)-N(3))-methyltransferase RlmH [Dysgonamonadaceae bacterium]|jgi:23S rRNA (pseudouridine1915-N3)-methyltransferase|nr:23S rRNA (pseudouridine(1915)-N(3))-methyltransferase RlmH [Dysgonamonadaceae bacterium]
MKIQLLVIGKTTQDFIRKGIDEYLSRLAHYVPFELKVMPGLKETKHLSAEQIKRKEGDILLKTLLPSDYLILLDERGQDFSSMEFAEYLKKRSSLSKRLVFIIGGAYGFSDDVYAAANEKIAFSKMTFSHQLIRLIFAEQLYRAMTILNNEPYHHE